MPPVKILVADLRPGMYIVDTKADWQKNPFLYAREGVIASMGDISAILEQGYTEAYYDPEQSRYDKEEEIVLPSEDTFTVKPPTSPLSEEIRIAERAYADCVKHAREFMQSARFDGKVHLNQAEPLVTNIIGSLNRNMDALTSLAKVKIYDEYTFEHSVNVSIFATAFGRFLGLDEQKLLLLGTAGIFHDTGKMLVPQEILNAPRRLTPEEFDVMKTHVQRGLDCLERSQDITATILNGVGQHHEKFNGAGYPNGVAGVQISLFGRLMSVADIYDALTAKRVYKEPLPPSKALSIMYGMRAETWEQGVVERFIKMLGIYPVGMPVMLSSGYKAVISKSNQASPLYPTMLVVRDPKGAAISPPREIDLSKYRDIKIKQPLTVQEAADIDIPAVLGRAV